MHTAFQHSQACSCHLPLSPQSLPLQPSCSQWGHLSLPAGIRAEGRAGEPRAGRPGSAGTGWPGWEGGPSPPSAVTPFNCSSWDPPANLQQVHHLKSQRTIWSQFWAPPASSIVVWLGLGVLQTANPSVFMITAFTFKTEVPLGMHLLVIIKHAVTTNYCLCATYLPRQDPKPFTHVRAFNPLADPTREVLILPVLADKGSGAQKGEVTCPRSWSKWMGELGLGCRP